MPLLRLPEGMRGELKDPLGPVREDVDRDAIEGRVVTVGDIVTATFLDAGVTPDVSVVDGRTKREKVDPAVEETWRRVEHSVAVENPAGAVTRELVEALEEGLASDEPTRIDVAGEEDLGTLPAIALADDGDAVVYGQPDEGMVHVTVDAESRERIRALIRRMETDDPDAVDALLLG